MPLSRRIQEILAQREPAQQLDLFSAVVRTYATAGVVSNDQLYLQVASLAGIDSAALDERVPIGRSRQMHSKLKRRIRFEQQSLRAAGFIDHVPGKRGVWELTRRVGQLHIAGTGTTVVAFTTQLGVALLGPCETAFTHVRRELSLIMTSPVYPIAKGRAYGKIGQAHYVDWLLRVLEPAIGCLLPGAIVALNLSQDVFVPGLAARSYYLEELLLALRDAFGLYKVDAVIWTSNKAPSPVRYASIERTMLNVAYEPVYLLTNDPTKLQSNNRRIMEPHSPRQLRLIEAGGERRATVNSDGAYRLREGSYANKTSGRIPTNVWHIPNTCPDQRRYKKLARAAGLQAHGAPFPLELARRVVEYTTKPGQVVGEVMAGSFTVPMACELTGRRWIASEHALEYVLGGALRLEHAPGFEFCL